MSTQEAPRHHAPSEPRSDGADPRHRRRTPWVVVASIAGLALALAGLAIWVLTDSTDDAGTSRADTDVVGGLATSEAASDLAVAVAERWGEAVESGDEVTIRALYTEGGAEIVDRLYRAVWTDVDAAVDSIARGNDFERVELVRVEEFVTHSPAVPSSGMFVAEYDVTLPPEVPGEEPDAEVTLVVVFYGLGDGGLIEAQDIYFPVWSSFVTGEVGGYPQRTAMNEDDWVIVE